MGREGKGAAVGKEMQKLQHWQKSSRSCSGKGAAAAEIAVGQAGAAAAAWLFVHPELHTGDSSIWAAEREGWREPPPAGHFPKHACSFLGILTTVCSSSSRRPSIPANTNPLCCIQRCREGTQGFGNCLESLQC